MPRGGKNPYLPEDKKRKKINLTVDPLTVEWLKEQVKTQRIGQGRIVDDLVDKNRNL
ncbi:hypothetical protein HNR65_003615 [Desulfosalsimonas propionicica]|uniref:Uncharacterized protein n=1 Tax=Desulfosalsimonas propionicica TaxID=332175 RepID=A0A7W0CCJ4_9BACT|nr:hypothetical protein [Desulfosalsimonas propionicica]MBA2883253.1 hypothetical protein [Desulfosalsimonas propionicica]